MRKVIEEESLPRAPAVLDGHLHGAVAFASWPRGYLPVAPRRDAIMPQVLARFGDVQTFGFRANATIELNEALRGRWFIGVNSELGAGDGASLSYALRALIGHRSALSRITTSVAIGVGVSDLGTYAPRGLEIPLEERVQVRFGSTFVHLWVEARSVFFSEMRMFDRPPLGIDEYTLGGGLSFEIGDRRIFAGAAYETRVAGTSTMFLLGIPVGDGY